MRSGTEIQQDDVDENNQKSNQAETKKAIGEFPHKRLTTERAFPRPLGGNGLGMGWKRSVVRSITRKKTCKGEERRGEKKGLRCETAESRFHGPGGACFRTNITIPLLTDLLLLVR